MPYVHEVPEKVGRIAMVARWKPVHRGHAAVLNALVRHADEVLLGLGSSNKLDQQNPFSASESAAMIECVLGPHANYRCIEVPDLGHGPRWRQMIVDLFGDVDLFVTANPYVRMLLLGDYPIVHPAPLVPPAEQVALTGTMVRDAMLAGEVWQSMVPPSVRQYLESHGLVERFRCASYRTV